MEVFQHAATQMLILFVIVFLGAIARKKHLMNDDFDALLSRLVMTVALPGMILDSVLSNTNLPSSETIFMMLGYSAVVYIILCALAALVARFLYRGVSKAAKGAPCFSYCVWEYRVHWLCGFGFHFRSRFGSLWRNI